MPLRGKRSKPVAQLASESANINLLASAGAGSSSLFEDDGGSLYSNPNDNSNPSYDLDDPNANHRQEGIRRDGEGNWQGALESFKAATLHNPTDAGGFNDLGVANMRVALKGIEIEKHLKSARAAYELSGEMSGGVDENLNRNLVRDPCCCAEL